MGRFFEKRLRYMAVHLAANLTNTANGMVRITLGHRPICPFGGDPLLQIGREDLDMDSGPAKSKDGSCQRNGLLCM